MKPIGLLVLLVGCGAKPAEPLSSPAMSLDRIEIRYVHKSGSFERTIRISPPDREAFLADCACVSGTHHVVNGKLVRT